VSGRTAFRAVAGAGAFALVIASAPAARAQAVLRVNETVSFRFGIAIQAWADWTEDALTGGYAENLFIRRARLYVGGQIAPGVTFLIVPVGSNLGKAPKSSLSSFYIEDGFLEWQATKALALDAGLILIPLSRNGLEQSVRQLTLDYGSFTFLANGVTQSVAGRDVGFQAKGYFASDRLEVRVGAFQGRREAGSRNSFRSAGRVQYNVFDAEKGPFYPGTYLGTKKVLAVGAGFDLQGDFRAFAGDLFLDLPVGHGNGVTFQFDFIRWDGGTTFPTLLRQNDIFVEGGYYVSAVRLLPWARFESQSFLDDGNEGRDQKRFQAGLTWYGQGHNFNVRAAYGRVIPRVEGVRSTSQFTLQLQLFYF